MFIVCAHVLNALRQILNIKYHNLNLVLTEARFDVGGNLFVISFKGTSTSCPRITLEPYDLSIAQVQSLTNNVQEDNDFQLTTSNVFLVNVTDSRPFIINIEYADIPVGTVDELISYLNTPVATLRPKFL